METDLTPFHCEPAWHRARYLVRISVYNGRNGYEGPCQVDKDRRGKETIDQTRTVLPLRGAACDIKGIGVFGFTTPDTVMYEIIKRLAVCNFEPDQVKWQVFAAYANEVEIDPEEWKGAFKAKRIWVCYSGSERDAWLYYERKKALKEFKETAKAVFGL